MAFMNNVIQIKTISIQFHLSDKNCTQQKKKKLN